MEKERVQRRLAAIVAADVAGYSRLTGADEEGTIARLRALRRELIDPKIAEHRGRIVKTTGDGILIEFASVVDAVRCAVEVQRGMATRNTDVSADRPIEFRVGIHIGDVVVEGDDLLGDGVNVAARLEGIAEPGAVCLSGDAYRQVKGKIDLAVRDLGEQQLKNIAEPVRVYALPPASATSIASATAASVRAPRLSIVVLPFANLAGDTEQDYFVEGITESLTTDLSRIPGAFVIARNTAFAYKHKAVDARQIGRELGVHYVRAGSVQLSENRMRVNAQLIDAETGAHLWAERFDADRAELLDMQDAIVARLARALDVELTAAEARRAERSIKPEPLDLTFRGLAASNSLWSPDDLTRALRLFDRALALDPNNVMALDGFAVISVSIAAAHVTDERATHLAAAEAAATKAVTLAPNEARPHETLAWICIATNRAEQGIAEARRAIELDRNWAPAYGAIGQGKLVLALAEEVEEHIVRALRLSPRDTFASGWCSIAGIAKVHLGRDDEAVAWLRRAIELNRSLAKSHFWRAVALARLGRLVEARAAARCGVALNPHFTIRRFRQGASSDNQLYLAQRERACDDMRRAGIPEE